MKINNLIEVKDGKMNGAMSPMLFAQEVCQQLDMKLDGLARVWWDNDRTLQYKDEESGMDSLVICEKFKNDTALFLFLDTGVGGIPVAFRTKEDEEITYTPIYEKHDNLVKPSRDEVSKVFETIFSDMTLITPKAAL